MSSARTLDAADKIDGGDGTDTLNVELQGNFTGFTSAGGLSNVETVSLTNESTIARSFTGTGVTGVEQYDLSGAVNLAGLTEISTVVAGARTADLSIAYASTVTAGTADSLSLSVSGFGIANDPATTANEEDAVGITVAGIETVALTAAGTNVVDLSNVAAKDLTAEGAGSLKVTGVNAATKTIDASGVTGAVNVNTAGLVNATSLSTGSGDDQLVINATNDVLANATLAGGEGTDTLVVAGSAAGTVQFDQSGFEALAFGAQGGALTMSLSKTADVQSVVALGGAATAGALDQNVTLASVSATDLAFNLQGENANAVGLSSDHTGATTIVVDTPATAATVAAPSVNDLNVTATDSTALQMSVAEKMSYTGIVTANKANSVELALTGAAGTGSVVNATTATSVAISSVGAVSDLTLNTAKAIDLNITNAKDLDLTGSTLTALESLTTAGAGDLNLTGVLLGKLNVANINNTGDVDLNNTGSGTLGYGTTVNSTGAATFDIGAMTTNNQNITLNVAGSLGAVTAAAIGAGTGDVNVASSTTSTTGLAGVTGKNVTIDASGTLGVVTFGGAITATGNVDIKGSELAANDLAANDIVLNGAAQTVSITGGVVVDLVDIVGTATTTSVTVNGDLGIGTDVVSVVTAASALDVTVNVAGLSNADGVTITTGAGADTITGSDGADTITAAAGANTMTGGAGFDTFVVVATNATASDADRITDFNNNAGEIIQVGAGGTAAASVQDQTAFDASAAANVAAAADLAAAATVGHTAAQYDVYLFTFGTSTYAFSDVDATTVGSYDTSGDVIVEITGTTVTDLTTANFDLA